MIQIENDSKWEVNMNLSMRVSMICDFLSHEDKYGNVQQKLSESLF